MNSVLRNILAVIAGLVVGSIFNMSLIMVGGSVVAPPEGVDLTTSEGLIEGMSLMEPRHFVFPFLAHALGTFVGAYLAARIARTRKMSMAAIVGVFFLIGGIANVYMLPSPMWFNVIDLVGAYLPMAFFGGKLAEKAAKRTL
jgi:uncharacterized membrane protein YqgA involved in biofilm formation